jgi:uncharacterized protein YjbJ (UPF0337 family)
MTTLRLDTSLRARRTGVCERGSSDALPVYVLEGEAAMEDLTKGASEQVGQAADQAKDAASGAMEQAQDAASSAMDQAQDAASGAMDQAKDAAGEALDKAKDILPGS